MWRVMALPVLAVFPLAAPAAELKHDMYVCANLSGQGQVMGGRVAVPSGLQRSRDHERFEHIGPNHVRLFSVTRDPARADTLFVAAMDGVLRSQDRGVTWRVLTDWRMTESHVVAFDVQSPDQLYAGLPDGIAVSRDRGLTWQRLNAGIRRSYTHALAVDRTKAGRVLAGTELGLYLTEDGARTWRLVQATMKVTYDLRQSPDDPAVFLAATAADGALRSADGGRSWRALPGVPKQHTLHNCDFDAADPRRIVLGGWGAGVLVSEDAGQTWSDRSAGLPNRQIWRVSTDPGIPGRLYAAPNLAPLYVSDDLGRSWRPLALDNATVFDIVFVARE